MNEHELIFEQTSHFELDKYVKELYLSLDKLIFHVPDEVENPGQIEFFASNMVGNANDEVNQNLKNSSQIKTRITVGKTNNEGDENAQKLQSVTLVSDDSQLQNIITDDYVNIAKEINENTYQLKKNEEYFNLQPTQNFIDDDVVDVVHENIMNEVQNINEENYEAQNISREEVSLNVENSFHLEKFDTDSKNDDNQPDFMVRSSTSEFFEPNSDSKIIRDEIENSSQIDFFASNATNEVNQNLKNSIWLEFSISSLLIFE